MMSLKLYFGDNFFIRKNIAEIFVNDYDVTNVFNIECSTIMSKIDYAKRKEARRSFLNIF